MMGAPGVRTAGASGAALALLLGSAPAFAASGGGTEHQWVPIEVKISRKANAAAIQQILARGVFGRV